MTLAISQTNINFAYLVASVCLIIGIKRLSSPATARSGNVIAAVGMGIAIAFTFPLFLGMRAVTLHRRASPER